jgi:precorrin-3B synthase
MTTHERRGWCPSLSAPMATGDGLLARFYPRRGELTPGQLAGLAASAARHGNGGIEITSWGNLQFRGLTEESADLFQRDVLALDIAPEPTPDVRLPPLATVPARLRAALVETAETLRAAIDAEGLGERLAPKFSLLVDIGEAPGLAGLAADLRLTLMQAGETGEVWQLSAGGTARSARAPGRGDRAGIVGAAMALARLAVAQGRGTRMRTVSAERIEAALEGHVLERVAGAAAVIPPPSIGRRELEGGQIVLALSLAFGQAEAGTLAGFCAALPASALLAVAPAGLLLVSGLAQAQLDTVIEAADRAGMVTRADDPRRFIAACAGAPGCASGTLATRQLARRIAEEMPGLVAGHPLYIGGCPKQCARPETLHVALTGDDGSVALDAGRLPLPAGDPARLISIAQEFTRNPTR